MKKLIVIMACLAAVTGVATAQTVALDDAIKQGAKDIDAKLPSGAKVVVLNFKSPSARLSDYVIEEMTSAIVSNTKLTVVDRQNLALIQQELNFQMSGEVSDSSAQEIGAKLGAQSIISGSFEDVGTVYRMRFRTIAVSSAAIQSTSSLNVKKDNQVATLLGGAKAATGVAAADAVVIPHGLKYTDQQKIGFGSLNIIAGMGSMSQGDWAGGLILAALEGASIALLAFNPTPSAGQEVDEEAVAQINLIGAVSLLGTIVLGYVFPFTYDVAQAKKNGTYYAMAPVQSGFDLSPVITPAGFTAVQVSYTGRL